MTGRKKTLKKQIQTPTYRDWQAPNNFFKTILDNLPSRIAVLDETGIIIFANQAWIRFGKDNPSTDRNCKIGTNYIKTLENQQLPFDEKSREIEIALNDMLKGKRDSFFIDYPFRSVSLIQWFNLRASLFSYGEKKHIIISHDDITDHKTKQERLEISEKYLRDLIDNLVDEVHVWKVIRDENGEIETWKLVDVNQSALKSWNRKREDVIGKSTNEIFENYDVTKQFMPLIQQLFKEKKPVIWESFFPSTSQYLSMISVPYGDSFISTGRDISYLKETENTLRFKNKELKDIIYTVSHDLRSPLVNIKGFSEEINKDFKKLVEILKKAKIGEEEQQQAEQLLTDEIPESLDFISKSASKMFDLLDGLLQVSRVGTQKIDLETIDINALLKQVISTMEFQISQLGVAITVETLPNCLGDLSMLDQVFTNLISNAIKYRDPSRQCQIRLSGWRAESKCVYCVEDNGIGIASAHQKKVFDIFHQLNPENDLEGQGLGLTIIMRIVERIQGRIWLESEPGKGSKFYVELPAS